MHASDLVELAGLIATNGPVIMDQAERLSDSGLEQYWTASKCRHECWSRDLKDFSHQVQFAESDKVAAHWLELRPVLEQIMTTEVLSRIWAAVCCGFEQRRGLDEASPVVRNVLAGHLEARNRALNLMVYGQGLRVEEAVALNRMRRRNERWTDVLLGYLAAATNIDEFAFSPSRAREFANDNRDSHNREAACSLLLGSLRMTYQRDSHLPSINHDLNSKVAAGILACLPSELFDATGLLKSLWVVRMQHAATDTQGMIEDLIALDEFADTEVSANSLRTGIPRMQDPR